MKKKYNEKIEIIYLNNFSLKFLHPKLGIYIVKSNDLVEDLLYDSDTKKINNSFILFDKKYKHIENIYSIIINEKEIFLENYELLFLVNGDN